MSDNTPYQAPESEVIDIDNLSYANTLFFSTGQRIGRLRWVVYSIVSNIVLMMLMGILAAILIPLLSLASGGGEMGMGILGVLMIIVIYGSLFAVSIILNRRRLHDLDQTGWLSLLVFVPLLNFLFALYLLFAPGTQGENKYGLRPQQNSAIMWVFGIILPIVFVGMLAAIALPAYSDYVERARASEQG